MPQHLQQPIHEAWKHSVLRGVHLTYATLHCLLIHVLVIQQTQVTDSQQTAWKSRACQSSERYFVQTERS